MVKISSGFLTASLIFLSVANASASASVPYKNQKAGQFCKVLDIGKTVKLPDGKRLQCQKAGTRARWKN